MALELSNNLKKLSFKINLYEKMYVNKIKFVNNIIGRKWCITKFYTIDKIVIQLYLVIIKPCLYTFSQYCSVTLHNFLEMFKEI